LVSPEYFKSLAWCLELKMWAMGKRVKLCFQIYEFFDTKNPFSVYFISDTVEIMCILAT